MAAKSSWVASIDDGDDDIARRTEGVPAFRRVKVGVGLASALPGVVEAPESAVGVTRIVRSGGGLEPVIGLGELDEAALPVAGNGVLHPQGCRKGQNLEIVQSWKRPQNPGPMPPMHFCQGTRPTGRFGFDQNAVREVPGMGPWPIHRGGGLAEHQDRKLNEQRQE